MTSAQRNAASIHDPEDSCGEAVAATGSNADDKAALAAYIADMSGELATLAGRGGMPMLAYFLNLARVEAATRSRELGGYPIDRQRR